MAPEQAWPTSGDGRIPLGRFCRVTAGPSGSLLDNLQEGPNGVPVIAPPDLTEHFTVDTRRLRRVSHPQAERLARFELRAGDVLLVRQGTLGRLALVKDEQAGWLYSSSCLRIRVDQSLVLPAYLAAYLTHPPVQRELIAQAQSGTVPSLNSTMLTEFPVEVPPMDRQHDVVAALADIDEQITVQRMMLDRLVALRPSVFEQLTKGE
ncbi:type I restriction enzyme S subunit [Streptomyces sp. B4I13]|uniref:Type I restriction enzyme S subunit n=1 Tax=Streptomyces achromogenes TaxID=67255 RepID=A0ABU0Q2H1_STRAH|nr:MULTISPECIES: restriction endonuclease subunit S [Streptomyces]MDQ0684864.1 type I restriction enzyme S subunit [Streptomyces achromogenes]MDQ0832042.1 type I restriction enzyme S subunit [Streptomyces achromogenes]MDQ0960363.1 type I restriction enzyme S subunit [Streptomyces sp. B4I13]